MVRHNGPIRMELNGCEQDEKRSQVGSILTRHCIGKEARLALSAFLPYSLVNLRVSNFGWTYMSACPFISYLMCDLNPMTRGVHHERDGNENNNEPLYKANTIKIYCTENLKPKLAHFSL